MSLSCLLYLCKNRPIASYQNMNSNYTLGLKSGHQFWPLLWPWSLVGYVSNQPRISNRWGYHEIKKDIDWTWGIRYEPAKKKLPGWLQMSAHCKLVQFDFILFYYGELPVAWYNNGIRIEIFSWYICYKKWWNIKYSMTYSAWKVARSIVPLADNITYQQMLIFISLGPMSSGLLNQIYVCMIQRKFKGHSLHACLSLLLHFRMYWCWLYHWLLNMTVLNEALFCKRYSDTCKLGHISWTNSHNEDSGSTLPRFRTTWMCRNDTRRRFEGPLLTGEKCYFSSSRVSCGRPFH